MAMPVRRKVFRIEEIQSAVARAPAAEPSDATHEQLIAELAALRSLMERRTEAASESSGGRGNSKVPAPANGAHTSDANGLRQLKDETDSIHRAIARTKEEIAALHIGGLNNPDGSRALRELDAVAGGAEHAIQQILAAAEDI